MSEKSRFANATTWQPGQSGNPSGRPRRDLAQEVALAIFEENGPALYRAYLKAALKGNGYVFETLANRAFGKLKESIAVDVNPLRDVSDQDLETRMAELEAKLGLVPATRVAELERQLEQVRALPPAEDGRRSTKQKEAPEWRLQGPLNGILGDVLDHHGWRCCL